MELIEFVKVFLLGIVEGVTEWLPISSTGHMILIDEFIKLNVSEAFKEMFFVLIQLGAIFAVIIIYWRKLIPFKKIDNKLKIEKDTISMWLKIVVASVPAAVIELLFGDQIHKLFYNYVTVAVMLIIFGVFFIVVEIFNKKRIPKVDSIAGITYQTALLIGFAQMIAAVFPGTSRSGATIVCALLLGISRAAATEFTFFLAIPAMLGASFLKLLKFGFHFSGAEIIVLLLGMAVAFAVSMLTIKFLMKYIKKHDFKVFGIYRIVLGCVILLYFILS